MAARPFWAALATAFLLAGPYLANLLVEHSRQVYMWRMRDNLVVAGLILMFAVMAVMVRKGLRQLRRPWLIRLYDHFFVLVFGAGLLANLWFQTKRPVGYHLSQDGMEIRSLWILLGVGIGWSLTRPGSPLVIRCRQLCTILSPAVVIVLFNLFLAARYPTRMDPLPDRGQSPADVAQVNRRGQGAVYCFIFDEWSFDRTYSNGVVRSDMPNLASLSRQATTFHDARSCGGDTETSVPRLLYETDLPVVYTPGQVGFQRGTQTIPTTDLNSIFKHYRDANYDTVMIGMSLPFGQIVGNQVDCCRAYPWFVVAPSLVAEANAHIVRGMRYWTDPWSQSIYDRIWSNMQYSQILRRQEEMKSDILDVLKRRSRTLAVFHYGLPHSPYMCDDSGNYVGPGRTSYTLSDVTGYERNLRALDRFIGEIVATLRQSGGFDDAMLVLTSDHGFRYDPERLAGRLTSPITHVPLIVKLPGQTEPFDVQGQFSMQTVSRLIDSGLSTGGNAPAFASRLLDTPNQQVSLRADSGRAVSARSETAGLE